MNETVLTPVPIKARLSKRGWRARTFYLSEGSACAVHRLARREAERIGGSVGAGVIVDRAVRHYLAAHFSPEEIVELTRAE